MNLVKFLFLGALISTVLGEFSRFPFGAIGGSITLIDLSLLLSIMFWAIWWVHHRPKIYLPSLYLPILGFCAVAAISLLVSLLRYPPTAVIQASLYLLRFVIYSLATVLGVNLLKSQDLNKQSLLDVIEKVGIALTVLGFVQLLIYPDLLHLAQFGFDPHVGRLVSTFLDPNFLGAYLVIFIALVLARLLEKFEPKKLGLLLAAALAVFLTQSRSAYLMLAVTSSILVVLSFFYLGKQQKKLMAGVLAVIFCLGVATIVLSPGLLGRVKGAVTLDRTSRDRIESWQAGLKITQTSPLVGVGFNNIRTAQEQLNLFKTFSEDGGHSGGGVDSGFIFILATTGVLGFLFYGWFWVKLFMQLFRQKSILAICLISAFSGLLVNGQFINSLFFPPIMLLVFSLASIAEG